MGKRKYLISFLWFLIYSLVVINFILVFTPEIGFDALWYHLTLPKLLLLKKQYYFSGGLLYYSVMPRLTETIFIPLIHYTGTVGPKLIQFLSGLGICFSLWQIAKLLNFSKAYKTMAISLFYCTWLVSWESSSAYIDLFRAFLETSALFLFLNNKKIAGGILLGLALGTKWLTLFSVLIYSLVFGWQVLIPALLVASPWFLISYHFTGNPVYPLFSSILQNGFQSLPTMLENLLLAPFKLTFPFDDFVSPLVGVIFSISIFSFFVKDMRIRRIAMIGFLGTISTLILDPPSSRFLLPFLPALIVSALFVLQRLPKQIETAALVLAAVSGVAILGLRLYAFQKYLPFLSQQQTQNQFLTSMSSRLPDTFIDSDDFAEKNLPSNSKILIDKLHNLYYFPYSFDHTSWSNLDQEYDYLVTKSQDPSQISGQLIHTNEVGIQYFKLR